MAYCPKCGASLPDSARFCGICGARLAVPANDPYQQQPRQYTQPQQQYQAPRQYAQPQQPAYNNRQYPPQQQQYRQPRQQAQDYGSARRPAYGDDYGWTRPEPDRKPVRPVGFLRILSLLFAVGLIAAAAAFGCRLLFNKTVHDGFIESATASSQDSIDRLKEDYRNGKMAEEEYSRYLKDAEDSMAKSRSEMEEYLDKYEGDFREILATAIREDPDGLKAAAKNAVIHIMKTQDGDLSGVTGIQQTAAEFYDEKKSDIDLFLSNWLKDLDNESILKPLNKISKVGSEKFGLRWMILQVGARWMIVAIAGGGLAFLCFLLWLICRGPSAGAGRSWFVPMLFIAILLSAALVAASWFVLKPISYREMADAAKEQTASETDMAEWSAIGDDLTDQAVNALVKEFETLKNIIPILQSVPSELVTPELIMTLFNSSGSILST